MKQGKLRIIEGGKLGFYCPACKTYHEVNHTWSFNGNYEAPTFSPSVRVTSGHYNKRGIGACWCTFNKEHPESPAPFTCSLCHLFVTDGKIQYLDDCSHELAGQTVEMVDLDDVSRSTNPLTISETKFDYCQICASEEICKNTTIRDCINLSKERDESEENQ